MLLMGGFMDIRQENQTCQRSPTPLDAVMQVVIGDRKESYKRDDMKLKTLKKRMKSLREKSGKIYAKTKEGYGKIQDEYPKVQKKIRKAQKKANRMADRIDYMLEPLDEPLEKKKRKDDPFDIGW